MFYWFNPQRFWLMGGVAICWGAMSIASAANLEDYDESIDKGKVRIPMIGVSGGTNRTSIYLPCEQGPLVRSPREMTVDSFWIGKYEVRAGEFWLWGKMTSSARALRTLEFSQSDSAATATAMGSTPAKQLNYPAVGMNHWAAKRYCHWLSMETGRFYRLPTEVEWEYACRAGNQNTDYPWGDDLALIDQYAVRFKEPATEGQLAAAGTKLPNRWGIHDMIGNAEEWVADGYDPLRRIGRLDNPIIWPVSNSLSRDPTQLREQLDQLGQAHCDGWGVAKGGSYSPYRCQFPHCFTATARTNPHLLSNEYSARPTHVQDENRDLSSNLFDTVGFRLVRPSEVPSRQQQLWHWGIYFDHHDWLELTHTPASTTKHSGSKEPQ